MELLNLDSTSISFRHMMQDDISRVVEIIEEHDDDDAQEAFASYNEQGVDGQYVMLVDDLVIGVSGANMLDDCDNSFELSWTYVDKAQVNKGYGRQLLQHVLDELTTYKARKVFIYVSDYKDENGTNIYEAAMHLYQSMGFEKELRIDDYYDEGETLTVLGKHIGDKPSDQLQIKPESPKIKFNRLIHIAETESAYSFGWQTKRLGYQFRPSDLETGLEGARASGATVVLVSFPSNYQNVAAPLTQAGFKAIGQLTDYYENGVHEDHYSYYL